MSAQSSEPLWTIEALCAATGGRFHPNPASDISQPITGITIDSRQIAQKGDLFIAIKGERFDGHQFCPNVVKAGAALIMVEASYSIPADLFNNSSCMGALVVTDCFDALNQLAIARRASSKACFIGITGSVGKTGLTQGVKLALSAYGKVAGTQGNLNNHIGLPLSLARMSPDADYGVFELGMNHAGEIEHLSNLLRPNYGIITNIASTHSEFFDHVMDIAFAKAELLAGMAAGSSLITLRESPYYSMMAMLAQQNKVQCLGYGHHPDAEFKLSELEFTNHGLTGTVSTANFPYSPQRMTLEGVGRAQFLTLSAVTGLLMTLNLPVEQGLEALKAYRPSQGRGSILNLPWGEGALSIIDESYNASPLSVRAALQHLHERPNLYEHSGKGRKIAVLSDLFELGELAESHYQGLAQFADSLEIDQFWLAGAGIKQFADAYPDPHKLHWFPTIDALATALIDHVRAGDHLLIKGSRGMKTETVIHKLQQIQESKHNVL